MSQRAVWLHRYFGKEPTHTNPSSNYQMNPIANNRPTKHRETQSIFSHCYILVTQIHKQHTQLMKRATNPNESIHEHNNV